MYCICSVLSYNFICYFIRQKQNWSKTVLCFLRSISFGGNDSLRFFENVLELKTNNIYNFISSGLTILVFAPLRIIQEVAKKCVFLKRKQLDTMFFVAVMLGIGITAIFSFIQIMRNEFSLTEGTMPVVVLCTGCAILIIGYVIFSTRHFVAYDELIARHLPGERAITNVQSVKEKPSVLNEPSVTPEITGLNDEEMASVMTWLKENDFVQAKPNEEIIHSDEIRKYQNNVRDKIFALEDVAEQSVAYSQEELALLQKKLDKTTPPGKYLSKEYLDNIQRTKQTDEVNVLEDNITSVPEDFRLCI